MFHWISGDCLRLRDFGYHVFADDFAARPGVLQVSRIGYSLPSASIFTKSTAHLHQGRCRRTESSSLLHIRISQWQTGDGSAFYDRAAAGALDSRRLPPAQHARAGVRSPDGGMVTLTIGKSSQFDTSNAWFSAEASKARTRRAPRRAASTLNAPMCAPISTTVLPAKSRLPYSPAMTSSKMSLSQVPSRTR